MTPFKNLLFILLLIAPLFVLAQSPTTEALDKKYDAMALFFYNNTLRMLNQTEDAAFDELIKDIEKMKLLVINKSAVNLDAAQYKKIVGDYKSESFEEIMTSRLDGKNFDVFVKEKEHKTKAMLVLVNDDNNLFVLDIVGSLALNKVSEVYNTIDKNPEIADRIKSFVDRDNKGTKDKQNH
jgi:hypothetical protein